MHMHYRESPTSIVEPEFAKWRNFFIGEVSAKALFIKVRLSSSVDIKAEHMMKDRGAFTTQVAEEEIETIILTPANFSYEHPPTTTELLDSARLDEWSQQNKHRLPEGHVVELLPAEAGPHIRDQYCDQPKGETLRIAMERIVTLNRFSNIFTVQRGNDGVRWFGASWAGPACQWGLGVRFVYRLRKVA